MKEILLTRGQVATVDDEDYESLSAHKWCARAGPHYALRCVGRRTVYMHRVILCAPPGMQVDHINGDRLDNRRSNLRLATPSQNTRNCGTRRNNTSGFKGVSWNRKAKRWTAQIVLHGQRTFLGGFMSPVQAHAAYCVAAKELHGEFARLA